MMRTGERPVNRLALRERPPFDSVAPEGPLGRRPRRVAAISLTDVVERDIPLVAEPAELEHDDRSVPTETAQQSLELIHPVYIK
jgi:hypothetical protein